MLESLINIFFFICFEWLTCIHGRLDSATALYKKKTQKQPKKKKKAATTQTSNCISHLIRDRVFPLKKKKKKKKS